MISKKNIAKFFAVLLVLGGFIFFADFKPLLATRLKIVQILAPVTRFGWFRQAPDSLLAEKDEKIKNLEIGLQNLTRENESLKDSLNFKTKTKLSLSKSSKVIFYGRDLGREFIIIDRTREEVKEGDLVIDNKGALVGVVQETNDLFSKVDMAYNPGRNLEAEITSLNLKVLAEGIGAREWSLELVPANTDLKTGELVSLVGGQLRSVVLGEIISVGGGEAFLESKVKSLVRPEFLDTVFILSIPKP